MTLTEAAALTRKSVKVSIFLIIAIIFIQILWGLTKTAIKTINPPPRPTADFRFGNLEGLKLPAFNHNIDIPPEATFSYKLQTIYQTKDGLPQIQDVVRVYLKPNDDKAPFAAEQELQMQANQFGFKDQPKQQSVGNSTLYTWQDTDTPLRTLQTDLLTRNFILQYDYLRDPDFNTNNTKPPNKEDAINIAQKFLKDSQIYQTDFQDGKIESSFWRVNKGALTPASNISEADFTRVDIFRADVPNIESNYEPYKTTKKLPIFTSDPTQGLVYFLFSGSLDQKKKIAKLSYYYWKIDTANFGTYPLISVQQAYDLLKKNKGYIASFQPRKPTTEVTITDVKLGYYESESQDKFLYPIYVFEGDDSFYAYIPASVNEKPVPPQKK